MRLLLLRVLRTTLRIFTLGIVGGYLIACLFLYLNQEQMLFHPTVLAHDFVYPSAHHYTEVFLPVHGAMLALVHFTQSTPKGVILYLHGNGGIHQDADVFAERFIRRGYDVILFDYRGYGKSTGSITGEDALHQDVQAVYAYIRQRYREDQIIIYGHSLGTGLAVRLAASITPRMVILESAYLSMQDLVAQKLPYVPLFLLKYPLRSDQWIRKVHCPIYFFHGTQDDLIPYDSSERLRAYSTAPTQLIPIVGGGHGDLATFAVYQTALDQILH
jgi:pimeloyl-ACP methyl ester carboxylesterase